MGSCCGSLAADQTAVITTWTDKELAHGPASCYCYNPLFNSVEVVHMTALAVHEYALVEDGRDPDGTGKFVHGPCIFKLEHAYQRVGPVCTADVLRENQYVIVTDKRGIKRTEKGPKELRKTFGDTYSKVMEAIAIGANEYVVLFDKQANAATPLRHVRGPVRLTPAPDEEILRDEQMAILRKCIEVAPNAPVCVTQADGRVRIIDEPQFYMPAVGEKVERSQPVMHMSQQPAYFNCINDPPPPTYESCMQQQFGTIAKTTASASPHFGSERCIVLNAPGEKSE